MIRIGKYSNIDNTLAITKACAINMIQKNIYQWNEHYPNKEVFFKDIERNDLYVLEIENTLVGCITISAFMDKEYIPIRWLTSNAKNIYLHSLAIHPNQQCKGLANKLKAFAEKFARENDFTSVRLDIFSQNQRNQKLYELRGYKPLGKFFFPKQSEHPFYCYELVL